MKVKEDQRRRHASQPLEQEGNRGLGAARQTACNTPVPVAGEGREFTEGYCFQKLHSLPPALRCKAGSLEGCSGVCAFTTATTPEPLATWGTDRESPSCACEEKGEGGAGIRLMILYFHCIIWHHRGPVSHFASQACGGSRKDCARWLRRPVPAPRPTLASPAPAPHCLEPDDQAAVATIPGTRWLVGARP